MMAAFSIDMESAGRPSLHHWAFLDSEVRIFIGVMPGVMGICLAEISGSQIVDHKSRRNLDVKAPM